MVDKEKTSAFVTWASNQNRIKLVVLTGNRVNNAAVQNKDAVYEWLVAVNEPELYVEQISWATLDLGDLLQDSRYIRKGKPFIRLLFEDRTRFNICLVTPDEMKGILDKDTLCEIVLDKDNEYGARKKPTDLSRRIKKPSEETFLHYCDSFFTEITDVVMYLDHNDLLAAQIALDRARVPLIHMVESSVSAESEFTLNPGQDRVNLNAYLKEEDYDYLVETYVRTNKKDLWDGVFKSCVLFRKMGLALAGKVQVEYPKEMDVNLLKLFRKLWEENR